MVKLLIGGSPCTFWSIAQTKKRETVAEGMGWELFLNYRIARDKYKPDYFLYENNKSMSPAIRAQITHELGVEPVLINSALVSAQNRQRLYWVGKRNPDGTYSKVDVEQPEDKGVMLRDILETGVDTEKAYPLCVAQRGRYTNGGGQTEQRYEARPDQKTNTLTTVQKDNLVADPVRIGSVDPTSTSQAFRVYSPDGKGVTLCGNGGGAGGKTGLYATPLRVCNINGGRQGNRIYSTDGKSCAIKAQGGGLGGHGQGLYAVPTDFPGLREKANCLTTSCQHYQCRGTLDKPIYEVRSGIITIKDQQYPIKLMDGLYIIRKLTVTECKRLQTVPDTYTFPVSNAQAYKMLGNGWTVDVIAHIMSHFDFGKEPVAVLSMYDGMSCGRIALKKLEVEVGRYYATEIDKYAIKTTMHNYPDTIQLGDAFAVRTDMFEGILW